MRPARALIDLQALRHNYQLARELTGNASATGEALLVQGDNDEYGTLRQLQWVQEAASHARQVVIRDCGHSPHKDQPDTLTASVIPLLAGLP